MKHVLLDCVHKIKCMKFVYMRVVAKATCVRIAVAKRDFTRGICDV